MQELAISARLEPPPAAAHDTDPTLIEAARAGDRAAFGHLHDRYAPMVHGLLLARVPSDVAEDLVQEVFLHAMRKLSKLRDPNAFGPWLATIARHFAVRFYRRQRRPRLLSLSTADEAPPVSNENPATGRAQEALAAIRSLPEAYREPLILRLVEGLNGPQIAIRTGLTPGSVRVNLHRGMRMLRALLVEQEEAR